MLDGCDPRHLAHEPVRVLHLLAVVVDQIRRLLGIAHRFDAGFADLEAHDRRELELTLAHQAGRAPQDRDAFPPAAVRPRGLRRPRSRDRAVHLRGRRGGKAAEHDSRVDGRAVDDRRRGRRHRLPGDVERIVPAQLPPRARQRLVELAVKQLPVDARGRVGDLGLAGCDGSHERS